MTGIRQSVERARSSAVGEHGVADAAYERALGSLAPALADLRRAHAEGSLPLLRVPAETGDLAPLEALTARLRDAGDVVLLGTGGSSLGGQAIAQAAAGYAVPGIGAFARAPKLHFIDNLDPFSLQALLEKLPLRATHFVAISKSGGTGETLVQTMAAIAALQKAGIERIADHLSGLSEPDAGGRRNALRALLEHFGCETLAHDTGIGGRFSVLTNVGMLPAALAGFDPRAIRRGAARALAPVLEGRPAGDIPAAQGAALSIAAANRANITVMLAYSDRLERFSRWWVQLWAESLGKQGRGTTPVAANGPVDQHSQLQLWLGGPRDKLFTVLTVAAKGAGPRIDPQLAEISGETLFGGRTIGDLVAAQGRATADTLARNGLPVRVIEMDLLDAETLGELFMHFMLETILASHLLGIDPYDQPAVEEGKVLAKRYLAGEA
jgi:glucose-6-phosphate isomerase